MPDGGFTTFSKYGLLGCCTCVIAGFGIRSQKNDAEAHAAAMGQLYGTMTKLYEALDNANDRASRSEEASRAERKDIMTLLLGVKTEAAAAKSAATTLKADVAKVQKTTEAVKGAVEKIE